MNPLFLSDTGLGFKVVNRKLQIYNFNRHLEFVSSDFPYDLIVLDNHLGYATFEALYWLSAHNCPIVFLNLKGKIESLLIPIGHNQLHAKLRIAQYEAFKNDLRRREIANSIIHAKHLGQNKALSELGFEENDVSQSEKFFQQRYFESYRQAIKSLCPKIQFNKRISISRNWNALDEGNCLLNYGYSILEAMCRKTLLSFGFETDLGFIHHSYESKEALVYDFEDLFRWLIDLAIVDCLENGLINEKHFYTIEKYVYRLNRPASKLLIESITSKLNFDSSLGYPNEARLFHSARVLSQYLLSKKAELIFPS